MLITLFSFLTKILHLILGVNVPQNFPPPLSDEVERSYFEQAAAGDEEARQKLILHNLRLVSHIVRKLLFPRDRVSTINLSPTCYARPNLKSILLCFI